MVADFPWEETKESRESIGSSQSSWWQPGCPQKALEMLSVPRSAKPTADTNHSPKTQAH